MQILEMYSSAHCEDPRFCQYSICHSCFPGAFSHDMHKTMYNVNANYCLTLLASNIASRRNVTYIRTVKERLLEVYLSICKY